MFVWFMKIEVTLKKIHLGCNYVEKMAYGFDFSEWLAIWNFVIQELKQDMIIKSNGKNKGIKCMKQNVHQCHNNMILIYQVVVQIIKRSC